MIDCLIRLNGKRDTSGVETFMEAEIEISNYAKLKGSSE